MMKHADCLFEIHTEELPPKAQIKLSETLGLMMTERLQKENIPFKSIQTFATPRRLAMIITDLADAQPDQVIERKGPALNAAFDKDGVPSKACEGFARSCGVTPKELLTIKSDQGEWVGYQQAVTGKPTTELLPAMLEQMVAALPIAKRMHWGSGTVEFARPVHSVILLYGNKVIDADIIGCRASNVTQGHRFMSSSPLNIPSASEYASLLETQGNVIADFTKRRDMIRQQITSCVEKTIGKQGRAFITDDLLDEVTGLVEYPVAFCGQFDKEFLNVPKEVLISSMRDHQRYFPVIDSAGELLPYFIAISNIQSKQPEQMIHGNERVLRARLSDAKFFFETDKHERLEDRVAKLKEIVYQAKLGTLHDKAQRLSLLTTYIANHAKLNAGHAELAGMLAKADLVTNMVGEFPELQGVMGSYYARHDQEHSDVAAALQEQYLPRFAGDALPVSKLGAALALADRLDSLVGSFGINQIPTGDKDPYGLRRAALGIVRILVETDMNIDLKELLTQAVAAYQAQIKLPNADTASQVLNFIRERMRAWYQDQDITPDVFAAVAALDVTNLLDFHKRILAVQAFKKLQESESLASANKRVSNILAKYQETMLTDTINPAFFEDAVENELALQLDQKSGEVIRLCQSGQYAEVLIQLASLHKPVDNFFDKVMVMTDDQPRRENRILLLKQLRNMFLQVADIALLQ
jgi:glycyl-tRNA synthetase beta chain